MALNRKNSKFSSVYPHTTANQPGILKRQTSGSSVGVLGKVKMKAPNYFLVKRQIELLKKLVREKAQPEEYDNLINSVFHGVHIRAIPHPIDSLLYRSRWNEKGRIFNHLKEVSYPVATPEWTFGKGRLNDAGQSVLYAARCELGTIIELRPEINRLFTTVAIRPRTPDIPFMPIGILNREFTIAPRNKAEELIREFFYSEITRQIDIDDGDAYNVTIAIGNFFFGKGIVGDRDNLLGVPIIGGVIYPSVAGKTISNVTTYNFAIPPKIFDRYFEIFEATIYCLTNEESHYQLNDVNKSVSLDSDGTIRWQFDFAEMKHRIAAGLCLNGTCKSLIHLEEQA